MKKKKEKKENAGNRFVEYHLSNSRLHLLPKMCMTEFVAFLCILGDEGYFNFRVPLRGSSGQFNHVAFPWCSSLSMVTSDTLYGK